LIGVGGAAGLGRLAGGGVDAGEAHNRAKGIGGAGAELVGDR
jgi:hypothetical protein